MEYYRRSIEINPKYGPCNGMSNVYTRKGDEGEARRWYEKKGSDRSRDLIYDSMLVSRVRQAKHASGQFGWGQGVEVGENPPNPE
jgi:hypothetical protein